MEDFENHDMIALAALVRQGEITPDELLEAALKRLGQVNPVLNAVVSVADETARHKIACGLPHGAFHGVPFLLKDLGCEAVDYPSHEGSRLMANSHWSFDATLYTRLAETGLVVFGRTATPENGIGIATEAAVYGAPTCNPWNPDRTPGGSSGGSAAAVAAGIVPAAHGSDGGGSIRVPAACCGLFGFKPSRGHMPNGPNSGEGWAGMATDGFLTRSVRDTAALLDVCVGPEAGQPYAAPPLAAGFTAALDRPPPRLKIALCDTRFDGTDIEPACRAAVHDAARLLTDMGHSVEPARPEAAHGDMMRAWTDIVACGTALVVASELKSKDRGLASDDLERVSATAVAHGNSLTGPDYLAAVQTIHRYGRQMAAFFGTWDMLLTPTLAEPPARIGRFNHDDDYLNFRLGPGRTFDYSPFAAAFNATGQPAMSVPLCWSEDGLPIGIHLAARFGADEVLMSLAADLERARPWFSRRPPALPARAG
ncbi:MAG: amidase [Silicimonas sp.]|nr:amidase [Silicimonas sp.]